MIYLELSAAKVALHSHVARQICGREDERRIIQQFCAQKYNLENNDINNPCLYIYGAPGTGLITSIKLSQIFYCFVFLLSLSLSSQVKQLLSQVLPIL